MRTHGFLRVICGGKLFDGGIHGGGGSVSGGGVLSCDDVQVTCGGVVWTGGGESFCGVVQVTCVDGLWSFFGELSPYDVLETFAYAQSFYVLLFFFEPYFLHSCFLRLSYDGLFSFSWKGLRLLLRLVPFRLP